MLKTKNSFAKYLKLNYILYIMMVPALIYTVVFKLIPLYGTVIAFKDYNMFNGANAVEAIANSEWCGFDNFEKIFKQPEFLNVLANTFIIAALKLVVLFPLPILMALLLNEMASVHFKKAIQTIVYIPHFFSWVVVAGIVLNVFGSNGFVNQIVEMSGNGKINFLMNPQNFLWVLVGSDAWKETGFNAVVYIAAIAAVSPELYEAAQVDGANKIQRMLRITLPNILPTIMMMFILKIGKMLEENFSQILVMYNPAVYDSADVIQTFVYRLGLGQMDFTLGVTVGLFNSVVSFALILLSEFICKKTLGRSVW
ncbi:MAG: ABC transporter permease subunit [Oscillospiraceae bacterium]